MATNKKAATRSLGPQSEAMADPLLQNLQKIDHLVILMMENRSFDHLLGYLSLSGGRADVDGLKGTESNDYRVAPAASPVTVKVHHLTSTAMEPRQDPCHRGGCVDAQVANGNAGFVQNFHDTHPDDPDPGIVMGYYDAADVPVYDFLAKKFGIADRWFSSVRGETWPNRLYMTSGKAAGSRDNKFIPIYRNKSWVRHLDAKGVSWKGYGDGLTGHCSIKFTDENYRSSPNYEPFDSTYGFVRDAAAGTLPAVSLIDPVFFRNDDHPPGDIAAGQALVARTYNALAKSPAWSRTLLIVVYDEHGGLYDHVAPPAAADDAVDCRNYGVRVPAFFVGPFVPRGKCFGTTFDHASLVKTILLRFCATNGKIPDMGARVTAANHLGEVLSETAARPAEDLPMPVVKKVTTQHAQAAFAELTRAAPTMQETSADEAALMRATKQLQAPAPARRRAVSGPPPARQVAAKKRPVAVREQGPAPAGRKSTKR